MNLKVSRFGRRRTIQAGVALHLILWICLVFSENLIAYGIVMTLCDGVSTFLLAVFSSYGVEIVGPSGRKYFGSLVGVAYALGFVLISVLAMYFPDRQLLTAVISGICAVNLLYLPFIPESPVWLLSTDRFEQVRTTVATIASTVEVDHVRSALLWNYRVLSLGESR